ncbi:MAG TPA: hypothetical protein VJ246_01830, partial [Patescibacteria group bacterium]|nr:hypothetical protein [Patescibacteria group bacterium]
MNRLSKMFLPVGFALLFIYVSVLLYIYRGSLFVRQAPIEWTKTYNASKYVMGERGSGISDD